MKVLVAETYDLDGVIVDRLEGFFQIENWHKRKHKGIQIGR